MLRRFYHVIVVLSLFIGACAAPISAQSEHFTLTMSLEQVGLGKRPITITLVDQQGNVVNDATITLLPVMRQHGMLSPPLSVTAVKPGVYIFDEVNLDMSGEWQMQVTITQQSITDMIEVPVMIE